MHNYIPSTLQVCSVWDSDSVTLRLKTVLPNRVHACLHAQLDVEYSMKHCNKINQIYTAQLNKTDQLFCHQLTPCSSLPPRMDPQFLANGQGVLHTAPNVTFAGRVPGGEQAREVLHVTPKFEALDPLKVRFSLS